MAVPTHRYFVEGTSNSNVTSCPLLGLWLHFLPLYSLIYINGLVLYEIEKQSGELSMFYSLTHTHTSSHEKGTVPVLIVYMKSVFSIAHNNLRLH